MAQSGSQPPSTGPDWTVWTADRIEAVVGTVRDKAVVPVQKIARGLVYGLVAGLLGALALVLLLVAAFRLHVYLPYHPEGRRVWTSYVGLGAILVLVGGLLWRKRTARPKG